MAEAALNKLHPRHCVSASKGFTFGEIRQVPKPSFSVPEAQEQAPKIELTCSNPPAMNLLEQKRVWDGDEENTGVFSTLADSCNSLQKRTEIFHKYCHALR